MRARQNGEAEDLWLDYDKLVLATGARPIIPPVPKANLENITTLHSVPDAEPIKALLAQAKAREVVMVGGGLIGVEAVEALVECDCQVTRRGDDAPNPAHAGLGNGAAGGTAHGVTRRQSADQHQGDRVRGRRAGHGVLTSQGRLPADLVVLGIGVRAQCGAWPARPGCRLVRPAASKWMTRMRTSDPDIYAAGDCAESTDLVTGKPCYVPMGSTANKQGRVAAINICGGQDQFPGSPGQHGLQGV